jgi:Cof subfamily protein (haloacid dehalogenase superfamily)
MGNDIRLVVVDLDGTTVGATNQISIGVTQAVKAAQAKGVQVAIATGRMYRSALRFHKELGSTLPLMCYQGAFIKDPLTEKVHQNLTVSSDKAEQLLDYFEQPELRHVVSVHFYINDQLYVREMSEGTQDYIRRSIIEPIVVGDLRNTLATEPTKVLALCDDPDLIDRLLLDLQTRYRREEFYFTNKGAAVQYMAKMLGLDASQVMTLGDNFNDVEMIQYAGIGVAMGDAPDGVKAIADWVAPSVAEDGAAVAIERYVL